MYAFVCMRVRVRVRARARVSHIASYCSRLRCAEKLFLRNRRKNPFVRILSARENRDRNAH